MKCSSSEDEISITFRRSKKVKKLERGKLYKMKSVQLNIK